MYFAMLLLFVRASTQPTIHAQLHCYDHCDLTPRFSSSWLRLGMRLLCVSACVQRIYVKYASKQTCMHVSAEYAIDVHLTGIMRHSNSAPGEVKTKPKWGQRLYLEWSTWWFPAYYSEHAKPVSECINDWALVGKSIYNWIAIALY